MGGGVKEARETESAFLAGAFVSWESMSWEKLAQAPFAHWAMGTWVPGPKVGQGAQTGAILGHLVGV